MFYKKYRNISAINIALFCFWVGSVVHAQITTGLTREGDLNEAIIYAIEPVKNQIKSLGFDFCPRIKLRLLSGIQPRYTQIQQDSVNRLYAIEDSIFYAREKIRCEIEKYNPAYIGSHEILFENHRVCTTNIPRRINIDDFGAWGMLLEHPERMNYILDSLLELIGPIDTRSPRVILVQPEFSILIPPAPLTIPNKEKIFIIQQSR